MRILLINSVYMNEYCFLLMYLRVFVNIVTLHTAAVQHELGVCLVVDDKRKQHIESLRHELSLVC